MIDKDKYNPKKSIAEKGKIYDAVVTDKIAKLFENLVTKTIY